MSNEENLSYGIGGHSRFNGGRRLEPQGGLGNGEPSANATGAGLSLDMAPCTDVVPTR